MSEFYEEPKVLDSLVNFRDAQDGGLVGVHRYQEIPDDWLMANKKQREDSMAQRAGEFEPACSIPVEIADDLLRRGYDVMNEPIRKTIQVLKALGLDYCILTNRQL